MRAADPDEPILDEDVQFSVFRPRRVRPGQWYSLLVFAYSSGPHPDADEEGAGPRQKVGAEANQILGKRAANYQDLSQDSKRAVMRRHELTIVPEIQGVLVNPPRRTFKWLEPLHHEEFRCQAAPDLDGTIARGRVTVFLGDVLIGDLTLATQVTRNEFQPSWLDEEHKRAYRRIFASYSHKDGEIVTQFADYIAALGDRQTKDCVDLRAGEVWTEKIEEMIRAADIFQLFWSWNSMTSTFVKREWEFALRLRRKGFVRPVYWEKPMPSSREKGLPPDELCRLHFHYLGDSPDPKGGDPREERSTSAVGHRPQDPTEAARLPDQSSSAAAAEAGSGLAASEWPAPDVANDMKESEAYEKCVEKLEVEDELNCGEALIELTDRFRPFFAAQLIEQEASSRATPGFEGALRTLWKNAEVVLMEDYRFAGRRLPLTELMAQIQTHPVGFKFRKLLALFRRPPGGYPRAEVAFGKVTEDPASADGEVFLRASMVHPHSEYRRCALRQLSLDNYWALGTLSAPPFVAVGDVLQQLKSNDYQDNTRKIYFDLTRDLLKTAKGKVRIEKVWRIAELLSRFDFFFEEAYFERLSDLLEALEWEEARSGITTTGFKHLLRNLREQKARVGTIATRLPSPADLPLVTQRSLARQGNYIDHFVRHPDRRIALETVKHITTSEAALRVLGFRSTNPSVVRELAKRRALLTSRAAVMSLVAHPNARLDYVRGYISTLNAIDLQQLSRRSDSNPDVRRYLRTYLRDRER